MLTGDHPGKLQLYKILARYTLTLYLFRYGARNRYRSWYLAIR
jgi:hypothetical protein